MKFNYDIAKTINASGREANPAIAQVVALVTGAPFALSLAQIMAVAKDAEIVLPTETTVRAWLQAAAERGEVARPTIRTYGPVDTTTDKTPSLDAAVDDAIEPVEADSVEPTAPAEEEDVLAGLM